MNLPTFLIALLLLALFAAVVAKMVRDKRAGKGGCSCGGACDACGSCGGCGSCCSCGGTNDAPAVDGSPTQI